MNRHDWEFEYTAFKLAEAASIKKLAHEIKQKWWETKKAEVMARIKETGIEVHDSVAAEYSNTKGKYGPEIVINATMQTDLTECQQKIKEHNNFVQAYDGWHQVLISNPEARLKLNHEDWLYFFSVC